MVQVDLPAAFAVGQIFAGLSKTYLKKDEHLFQGRLLGPFNLYLACAFAPVGMFLLIGWPSWEVMYRTPWFENPFNRPLAAGAYILFGLAMMIIGNLGFILAHHWYRKGRDRWVVIGSIIGVALTLLPFLLRWGIWMRIGTYHEVVEQGAGYSFWSAPFNSGWLVMMSYLLITTVGMGLLLKRWSRTLEP